MGAMYEDNQAGKRQEILPEVFNVEAESVPALKLLNTGKTVANSLAQWQMEKYPDHPVVGILDGTPVTTFDSTPRVDVFGCVQQLREPWKVTDRAQKTQIAGVPSEAARQLYNAIVQARRQQEKLILSDQSSAVEAGAVPWQTRGMFEWVKATAQSHLPVPADFRNSANAIYSGTVANLNQPTFEALLAAAYTEKKAPVNLQMFAGIDVKSRIDGYTEIWPVAASTEALGIHYNNNDPSKYRRNVKVLEFSYGVVTMHLSLFNLCDLSTGAPSVNTPRSFIGFDLENWDVSYMADGKPANTNLPPDGSGKRGVVDLYMILRCHNNLGSIKGVCNG